MRIYAYRCIQMRICLYICIFIYKVFYLLIISDNDINNINIKKCQPQRALAYSEFRTGRGSRGQVVTPVCFPGSQDGDFIQA